MVDFAASLSNDEDHVDAYHDDKPLRYHIMDNIFSDQPIPRLATHLEESCTWRTKTASPFPSRRRRETQHGAP